MKPLLGDENWGEDFYIDSLQKNEKMILVKHRERKERRRKKKEKSDHLCFFEFLTLGGPKLFIVLVLWYIYKA